MLIKAYLSFCNIPPTALQASLEPNVPVSIHPRAQYFWDRALQMPSVTLYPSSHCLRTHRLQPLYLCTRVPFHLLCVSQSHCQTKQYLPFKHARCVIVSSPYGQTIELKQSCHLLAKWLSRTGHFTSLSLIFSIYKLWTIRLTPNCFYKESNWLTEHMQKYLAPCLTCGGYQ